MSVRTGGRHNAITDVAGILVGQVQRIERGWASGTTVLLVPDGAVGGVDQRGGAPGTRETDLLAPENLVERVHAICLSGGSAYGLAAADGVLRYCGERGIGLAVGTQPHEVVPIVPAAVLFDLPRSNWGNRPDAEFGYAACAAAADGAVRQGTVGAGTGATAGALKGGLGTASVITPSGHTVAALAVTNAHGQAVDSDTGRPFGLDAERDGEFGLRVPGHPGTPAESPPPSAFNTTIGAVATDAALSKAECKRLAMSGQDGLVRAISPAHSVFDGDTVFGLATCSRRLAADRGSIGGRDRALALDELYAAAAGVFCRAVVHGVLSAVSIPGAQAYRDRWPQALRRAQP